MKKKIIVIPVKKIEVYSEDCYGFLNYHEAKEYCKGLGKDWRLPTQEELLKMHEHRKELGLKNSTYWSSTEYNAIVAYSFNFFYGNSSKNGKYNSNSVRAVRTIN